MLLPTEIPEELYLWCEECKRPTLHKLTGILRFGYAYTCVVCGRTKVCSEEYIRWIKERQPLV